MNGAEIKGDKVTLDLETKKGDKDTLDADVVLVCAGSFLFRVMVMHDPIQAMPSLHQQHTVIIDLHDKSMCAAVELSMFSCMLRGLLCCCATSYAASCMYRSEQSGIDL